MTGNQFDYVCKAKNLPCYNKQATPDEKHVFQEWLSQQADLSQTPEGRKANIELIWASLCIFGGGNQYLPVTTDNLNALKNSSTLLPLLEKNVAPKPKVPTVEEIQQAEAELAKLEPKWTGVYDLRADMGGVKREIVSYKSPENLQMLVNAVCDPNYSAYAFGVASGESFLIALRQLVADGYVKEIRTPDRPMNDKPATPLSVREALEKDAQKKQQQHVDTRELQQMKADCLEDMRIVRNVLSAAGGMVNYAETYDRQKVGLESLHKKWDSRFEKLGGEDFENYKRLVGELEQYIERKNPYQGGSFGGTTRVNASTATVTSGASFSDVMQKMRSTVEQKPQRRGDALGDIQSVDVKIPFNRR